MNPTHKQGMRIASCVGLNGVVEVRENVLERARCSRQFGLEAVLDAVWRLRPNRALPGRFQMIDHSIERRVACATKLLPIPGVEVYRSRARVQVSSPFRNSNYP